MVAVRENVIRIASVSGSTADRGRALHDIAKNYPNDPVNVIVGDWMSEGNMPAAISRKLHMANGEATQVLDPTSGPAYESNFVDSLVPALPYIAEYGIKVAVNAGGADVQALQEVVNELIQKQGLQLKTARIEGDNVLEAIKKTQARKESRFENICTGQVLDDWNFQPIGAQCYLGGLGIAAALKNADIVLCGRVSDASPTVGAAYWWYDWKRSDLDRLANALIAGHLIECSSYICGGNFSGFKTLLAGKGWDDLGYPIAEISAAGDVVITKAKQGGGFVTIDTCKAQLLYEIQGPWYFNSDVTATIDEVGFTQLAPNRVALHGVKSSPPPPTTKVGITAQGGFQAESLWYMTGLDIEKKAQMWEAQLRRELSPYSHRFSLLKFMMNGTCPDDPVDQDRATVGFRIFAQAPRREDLAVEKFMKPIWNNQMQAYPGATFHNDHRTAFPKPYFEYYVTLLPQSKVHHTPDQPSTADPASLQSFGPTTRGPLGWIVHSRSGDKGSDANCGFWVRHEDEYDWLRSLLSTEKMKELLAKEYNGKKIDRFELPNAWAIHFLFHDHLDRGIGASSTYDIIGKNVGEFLRARYVDIPEKFLSRGRI
ncbi:hypothetical protein CLAIMM_07068 [Cladophialophora immunda]|nr:hypothetical protein CLAIMM_07068 [Cladophialophora immunda]